MMLGLACAAHALLTEPRRYLGHPYRACLLALAEQVQPAPCCAMESARGWFARPSDECVGSVLADVDGHARLAAGHPRAG